ncbi:MAG: chromate efflux transporter [Pseudomonadota bacterium]|nr:chromate efflux transporter [Pseudomonadota bacterium]
MRNAQNDGSGPNGEAAKEAAPQGSAGEVFAAFLKLGFTAFGGPVAHLGYFRDEFVQRRRWFSDGAYGELVALCQFLPGPASSQVGFAIGLSRAGFLGALAAWTAFTLPSAIALVLFAFGVAGFTEGIGAEIVAGLKIAAVAVVAQALVGMARSLAPDAERAAIAAAAIAILAVLPGSLGQIAAILAGGLTGLALLKPSAAPSETGLRFSIGRITSITCLAAFAALLVLLPLLASGERSVLEFLDGVYRSGALVFGGGHVVLPLLQAETVSPGYMSETAFLAGYGAAQAVPGPLFTFAAYLGAVAGGLPLALGALVAVFLPGMLLLVGVLPFWAKLSRLPRLRSGLAGTNAAVVGVLAAAFYEPVFVSGIADLGDFALAAAAFVALVVWKAPPWAVVLLSGLGGLLVA